MQLSEEQIEQRRTGDDTREAAAGNLPEHGGDFFTLQVLDHAADSPPGSVFLKQLTKALAVPVSPEAGEQAWQQSHSGVWPFMPRSDTARSGLRTANTD